jgi:selenocysteine lyase/cysteine desulfurase
VSLPADQFRALFPALRTLAWLDTPACCPLAEPVRACLQNLLASWSDGIADLDEWDGAAPRACARFASWLNVAPASVAAVGSFAEGAAAIAAGLPPGRIIVGDNEFRSNLLPWLAMDQQRNPVTRVAARDGVLHSQDLAAAISDDTVLVAVSEVLSSDGARQDLPLLRQACDATGARLLVDATQSLGVLRPFTAADYLIAHGYKWLLCPRGAGFLVAKPARYTELRPPLPSWKTGIQQSYFGGSYELAADAGRVNTSPAWLPWLAAEESLTLLRGLHQPDVERHCLRLARTARAGAEDLGYSIVTPAPPGDSHILTVRIKDPVRASDALTAYAVRAKLLPGRVRVGFHYFNDDSDVSRFLLALRTAR